MPPRRTEKPRARTDLDIEAVLMAVVDTLEAEFPGWRARLDSRALAAIVERRRRRGKQPNQPSP